ncbi:MAG: glycosyltransferase family 4 protein [Nitrososphaerota archaeon]
MGRVLTFVRCIAGLLEPSLESEFYEEFSEMSRFLEELIVVTDRAYFQPENFKVYKAWTLKIPKLYGLTKIISYVYAVFKFRKSIDLVYVRTFSPPEILALYFAKKILNKKAALLIPGTWIFEPPTLKNRLFRWIFSKVINTPDKIILYSPLMIPDLYKYFPRLDMGKITYIHNGINVRRFSPNIPNREILEKYSVVDNRRFLLYVGRISSRKGVIDLVRAFSIIHGELKNTVLLIAGGEDPKYSEKVKKTIQLLNLADSVKLLGPVPNKDVVELLRACDVFLYTSMGGEGIPRAVLEAMSCGKPVVATRVAGTPEAVKDGVTGYTVDIGDYKSIANYVIKILKDDELRKALGDNARKLILEEFNYETVIPQLTELLDQVIKR